MLFLPCRSAWQSGEGIKKMKSPLTKPQQYVPIQVSAGGSNPPSNNKASNTFSTLLFPHPILPNNHKERSSS